MNKRAKGLAELCQSLGLYITKEEPFINATSDISYKYIVRQSVLQNEIYSDESLDKVLTRLKAMAALRDEDYFIGRKYDG